MIAGARSPMTTRWRICTPTTAAVDQIKVSYDRPTILAMVGNVRGKRVLDVGCASGGLSEAFAERGARVVGVDLNPRLIERARERLGSKVVRVADIAAPRSPLADDGWLWLPAGQGVLLKL